MLTIKKAPRKPRPSRQAPWRADFREVPAEQRRAGRYALQLLAGRPALLYGAPGDFANVVRQRNLLGEELSAEDFLRRLAGECRWKERGGAVAA